MSVKDAVIISYLCGIITSVLAILIYQTYSTFNNSNSSNIFFSSFTIYRFVFCFLLSFWFSVITRYSLRLKHLNYIFVLDIRPKNLGEFHQFVVVFTAATVVYLVFLGLELYISSLTSTLSNTQVLNTPAILLYLLFFGFLFFPVKSWLRDWRFSMLKIVLECVLAPLFPVKFVHILVADCLTSVNKVILDVINGSCWIYGDQWEVQGTDENCNFSMTATILIYAAPFVFRFMQCLRRYRDTGLVFPNLWNALKYALSIASLVLGNLWGQYPAVLPYFIVFGSISYVYNNYWDNVNDWGLFEIRSGKNIFLREKMRYSASFYYSIMILNLFFRLSWLTTLISKSIISDYFGDTNMFLLITMAIEIIRRFLWSIIRVEHEINSNFEKIRDLNEIPTIFHFKGKKKRIQII